MRQVSFSHWGPFELSYEDYEVLWRASSETSVWQGWDDFEPRYDKKCCDDSKFPNVMNFVGEPKLPEGWA